MSNNVNRQWRLVRRPEGQIRQNDFQLAEAPIPTPEQGRFGAQSLALFYPT